MQADDQEPQQEDVIQTTIEGSPHVVEECAVDTLPAARRAARALAVQAALVGQEKHASHIQIIDLNGRVDYADYLVLMTGSSNRNVSAIAHGVEKSLEDQGHRVVAMEGLPSAEWVLIDLFDVVVHVFQSDWRKEYDLDGLWADAPRISF